jgi:uncharacterized membrane protein YbhN (UPF0104 family)
VSGALVKRIVLLAITGISLYIVAPTLLEVLGSWKQLGGIRPGWFAAMLGLQAGSLFCMCWVQRLAFREKRWYPVITSQLAASGFSRIVPGGAPASAALQYGMLVRAGVPPAAVASGLSASSIVTFGGLLALPLLALPGIVAGTVVPDGLARVLWLGLGLFVVLAAAGAAVMAREGAIRWAGQVVQQLHNRILRRREPLAGLPDRLAREREVVLRVLGDRWKEAVVLTAGKWVLDFLTLLAALAAVGSWPAPTLVLLAYCGSQILGQIPLTPGGLGFVEAGLTGTLALAGVRGGDAVVATFAYRLFSYWLYLPAGLVAAALHARRYGRAAPGSEGDVAAPSAAGG